MKKKMALGLSGDAASKYEDTGMCSFCLLTLQSLQPGGRNPRHKATLVPYGQCVQAINAKKTRAE
jgi:hypothetical protein